jgi:hypothetical protein
VVATLARTYTRRRLVRTGVLALGGGVLLPSGLVLGGSSPWVLLVAALLPILASLLIRFRLAQLPHAHP